MHLQSRTLIASASISWCEFPQIIEVASVICGVNAVSRKHPEIASRVNPSDCVLARSGYIANRRCALCAIHGTAIHQGQAADPGPGVGAGAVFPQIVEVICVADRVETISAKHPEIAAGVYPGNALLA